MADNVTFTAAADATPPAGTQAATDELSDGSHAGIAKLAISANGDRTFIPATAADGLLVEVSNAALSVAGAVSLNFFRGGTGAQTSVADNASSTTLLAANANRVKCVITNDSSARLYIRFEAAAASTTAYGVSLGQNETWEEFNYTGEIRGIWASDPNDGAARITEIT